MKIRNARYDDTQDIMRLLRQVNDVHADGRPDLFRHGHTKYTERQLHAILDDPATPVFIAENDRGSVAGYCFCIVQDHADSNNLQAVRTLYIDDLCVDEECRGRHVGQTLYAYVRDYARRNGFYNLTLNVWSRNPGAIRFYESLGMTVQKIGMEEILSTD